MIEGNMKFKIFKIEVSEEKQIIPIDFKLSNDIESCEGIYISVKELLNIQTSTIPQLGELSLMLNAKAKHPIHFTTEYSEKLDHKKEFLKLNCDIVSNTNITGFYTDYGKTKESEKRFLPYTIQVYLMCKQNKRDLTK